MFVDSMYNQQFQRKKLLMLQRSSEIIENWIIDKLRKKEIEIRKLLRSF